MRNSDIIRKIKFKDIVPAVFRDIREKPKLLVPFIISFFVNIILMVLSAMVWSQIFSSGWFWGNMETGDGVLESIVYFYGVYYLLALIGVFISLMISVFFSGWIIVCYKTYIQKRDFELIRSLKRSLKYYPKLLGASILASVVIFVIWGIPSLLIWLLIQRSSGPRSYGEWSQEISLLLNLASLIFSTFFIFTHHSIIIEKERVVGSLKRSFHVAKGNFWKIYLVLAIPGILTVPTILLRHIFEAGISFSWIGSDIAIFFISWLITLAISILTGLIMIRIFITSVIPRRSILDDWGFHNH